MIKPVSVLAITIVGMMSVFPSNSAPMTSQIQRLLDQKEEKIKQLEECEGKKQGWMIAGISTIGLTAVGVGVNIAQANKSNRLSGEIEQSKQELERQQEKLSRIEGQISKKEQEKTERERAEQTAIPGAAPVVVSDQDLSKFISGSKEIGFKTVQELVDGIRFTYSDISIECGNKYAYAFIPGDENTDDFKRVKNECVAAGGEDFVKIETKNITKPDGSQSVDIYQCKADWHCEDKKDNTGKTSTTKKEGDTGPKEQKETSLQKCLRERSSDPEGTACCYLSKSVAEYVDGKCECKGDKEFSIDANGQGRCTVDNSGDDVQKKAEVKENLEKAVKKLDDAFNVKEASRYQNEISYNMDGYQRHRTIAATIRGTCFTDATCGCYFDCSSTDLRYKELSDSADICGVELDDKACTEFCRSKENDLIKICDDLNK